MQTVIEIEKLSIFSFSSMYINESNSCLRIGHSLWAFFSSKKTKPFDKAHCTRKNPFKRYGRRGR